MLRTLSSTDANFFLLDSPTTRQSIASLSLLQGKPDREALLRDINEAMDSFPRIREKLSEDGRSWILDADFKLENHVVFHPASASPLELLSQQFSQGLDPSRPLWCFHIVEHLQQDSAMVLFMIHHGFSDGVGGIEFVHAVTREKNPRERQRLAQANAQQNLAEQRGARPIKPKFFASMNRLLKDILAGSRSFPFHGRNSGERQLSLLTLPLTRAKQLKGRLGVSLNDVLLAYVAGGFSRLLEAKPQSFEGRWWGIPAFIPFSLRPRRARRDLGNFLSAVPVELPLAPTSAEQSVRLIHEQTQALKAEGSFDSFRVFGKLIRYLPKRIARYFLEIAVRRGAFICTNVPGSRRPLTMGKALITANFGCAALLPGQGLGLALMCYADTVCICLVTDPKVVFSPDEIISAIRDAEEKIFEELGYDSFVRDTHSGTGAV